MKNKIIFKTLMLKGEAGSTIVSMEKTGHVGTADIYTITFNDGSTTEISLENMSAITSVEKTSSTDTEDIYTITCADGSTQTFSVLNHNADIAAMSDDIDTIDARVDNFINSVVPNTVETLWTGSIQVVGDSATLSKAVSNFDYIDLYLLGSADSKYIRVPSSQTSVQIQQQNMSDDASSNFLRLWEMGVSISGTTVSITKSIAWAWDDPDNSNPTVTANAQNSIPITRIDGVKVASDTPAELADVRVGADGVTYGSAGAAVRGQINGLKEDLNSKIDTITDGFDVTATGKTSLYLDAGDTVVIDVKSITGTVNAYIDGHSSENVLALTAVSIFEYTAVSSGYLRFYFVSSATMDAHVTLKNALGQNVDELINSVSVLEDAGLKPYDVVLESGDYDSGHGTKVTNAKRLRTSGKIPKDVDHLLFSNDYKMFVYAYDTDGSFVGSYTGSGFSTDWQLKRGLFSPVDMRSFDQYNYQFTLSFIRLDDDTATTETLNFSAVSGIAKNLDKEFTDIKEIALEYGSIDTGLGTNYANQNALRTPAFLTKYATKITFSNCKARFFAYTLDGVFVGGYGTEGYTKDYSKYVRFDSPVYIKNLDGENYLFRVVFDQFTGDVTKENADVECSIDVLSELKNAVPEVYTVGNSGDFETFTEMLIALENNTNEKIVYVQGGTYDIFEEMGGAEYIASLTDASSLNWRDVCHVVPWNTTIIGVGDVVLAWNPTDAEIIDQDHAFLFSPLNVSGTCKIKNIKIECSNARYGIHDETSGRAVFNGAIHEFENVSVIYSASTYGIKYAYGAGHNKNMKFKFKNCLFSAPIYAPWSSHDWPDTAFENSTFEFDNCIFLNTHDVASGNAGSIRFASADTTGRLDDVKINACVFDTIIFSAESAVKQGYMVTTTLCKAYTPSYSANIAEADRIAPKDYLILP